MKRLLGTVLVCALALAPMAARAAGTDLAVATTQEVEVDGKGVEFETYALLDKNGFQTNYAKLRDVAWVLRDTDARFSVDWSARAGIAVATGRDYDADGTEMSTPYAGDRAYQRLGETTAVDGQARNIAAIRLYDDDGNGYTYYKLRDLGEYLGFQVDWSAQRGVYVETDKVYGGAPRQRARELAGTWTGSLDISGTVAGVVERQDQLRDYFHFGAAQVDTTLVCEATGRYTLSMDRAAFAAALDRVKEDFVAGMVAFAQAQAQEAGVTLGQALAQAGKTQAQLEAQLGAEFESGMAQAGQSVLDQFNTQGVWQVDDRGAWHLAGGGGQVMDCDVGQTALTLRVDETTSLTLTRP